jgi:hypothetical protein
MNLSTADLRNYRTEFQRRIAPLMVTYHYVKIYVSIIIQLEVININVQNFKLPKDPIVNPTPFEPPKIWLWYHQNLICG